LLTHYSAAAARALGHRSAAHCCAGQWQKPGACRHIDGSGQPATTKLAGFAFGGDDPRPFLQEFNTATQNLPQFEDAADGIGALTGWPTVPVKVVSETCV